MDKSTKLEVEGGELLIKSSKGIMAVIPKNRVDYVKDLIARKNFAAVDKYVQTLAVLKQKGDKAEDGGVIQDPPIKSIAPSESTGNIHGAIARMNYRIEQRKAEKEKLYQEAIKDKTGVAEEAFVARYNTSPHRYKYDTDPEYRKQVDKKAEETSKRFGSIDLPATDVRSRNYAGNPNLAFMTQKGMSKEGRKALEESNLEIIGTALPIPGVESVGKIPSLTKLGGKMLQGQKAKQIEDVVGSIFDADKYKFYLNVKGEEMRKLPRPEASSPEAITLSDFKSRIQTPEGKKRLDKLGITEDQLLQELELVHYKGTTGEYHVDPNIAAIHPQHPLSSRVARHEIEHAVQNAYQKSRNKNYQMPGDPHSYRGGVHRALPNMTDIDRSMGGLELKVSPKTEQEFNEFVAKATRNTGSGQVVEVDATTLLNKMNDVQSATDYYVHGSANRERGPFLAEVQQYMLDEKIINDPYKQITIDDVQRAYKTAAQDPSGKMSYIRLFNIMKPTSYNFALIRDNLNKMLSLTGAAGAGAAAQKTTEQNEK